MRRLSSSATRVVAGLSCLCLLSLALSFLAVARGLWPFDEDAISLFGPWRIWASEILQGGVIPLWNPHLFGGMPFISNGQTAVLYPPNLVYWLLPIRPAMLLDAVLHSILLGIGGYLLARALSRGAAASWLCAICLMLGNSVASHLYAGHMTWHAARAYLPLIVWALICFLRYSETKYLWALAVFFALQVFSGYPPYVLWSVCWCIVFFSAWLWANPGKARAVWRSLFTPRVLTAGVLLVLLSAVVVLPLRETSVLSTHGDELTFRQASIPSSTLGGWLRLVLPSFFGGSHMAQWSILSFPHEEAAYIGLLPLVLAMFSPLLWKWRRQEVEPDGAGNEAAGAGFEAHRFVNALWLILPIAMLLALGKYTPLYRVLFDYLPPLRMFRVPARWFEIWYFAACVLAAFGLDAYLKMSTVRIQQIFKATAFFVLLLVVLAVALGVWPSQWQPWIESAQWNKKHVSADFNERLLYADYLRRTALQSVLTALFVVVCTLLVLRRAQDSFPPRRIFWTRIILGSVACDLLLAFWMSARLVENIPAQSPWPAGITNYYSLGDRWNTGLEEEAVGYGLNQGIPLKIDIFGGYDVLATKDVFTLAGTIEGRKFWSSRYQPEHFDPLLKVVGVTHLLASRTSDMIALTQNHGGQLIAKFGSGEDEIQLWKVPEAWPRVYLTKRIFHAPHEDQLSHLRELAAQNGAHRSTPVVVDEMAYTDLQTRDLPVGRVLGWQRPMNKTIIEVETSSPQILVQSESLYPGWQAWINGKPAKIERANFLFRSVQVPSGKSRVVFVYDNQTYRFGAFLSLIGLALLAGAISFAASNRRTRRPAAATSSSPS